MITYIAQSFSNSYQDIVLYKYINGNLASKTPTATSDLKNIIDDIRGVLKNINIMNEQITTCVCKRIWY